MSEDLIKGNGRFVHSQDDDVSDSLEHLFRFARLTMLPIPSTLSSHRLCLYECAAAVLPGKSTKI
jgi:hypothetical protein